MSAPLPFLQIEPTTRCNYSCGFCAGRHMVQGDLAKEVLQQRLAELEGLEHVELQGEGEPLLHEGFFELVALLRERFPQVGLSTITNGSLFTEANIPRLLAARFTRINISMESADPERFRAIRGGKFERLERGVAAFMAARGEGQLPAVGLAVTVLRDTATDAVDTILPFYRRLGLDGGIMVQPLQRMPQYVQFYDKAMLARFPGQAEAQRFQQRAAQVPDFTQALGERGRVPGFYEQLHGRSGKRPVCAWLEHGMFLTQDGSLTPCCFVKDTARHALAAPGEPMALAIERRAALAAQLSQGQVPPTCTGCTTAHRVAAAARTAAA